MYAVQTLRLTFFKDMRFRVALMWITKKKKKKSSSNNKIEKHVLHTFVNVYIYTLFVHMQKLEKIYNN